MTPETVRGCLRRAADELEGVLEYGGVSDANEKRLTGIVEQLRYHVEHDAQDPEALVFPDPGSLDTMRTHLDEVRAASSGDVATRLERASDEVLRAVTLLDDRLEKQREV